LRDFIKAYLDAFHGESMEDYLNRPESRRTNVFSAEVTSLYLLGREDLLGRSKEPLDERDRVVLFSSDTRDGLLAAHLCAGVLGQLFPVTPVSIERIQGLDPRRFTEFFAKEVRQFSERIPQLRTEFPELEPILNITGGFKGLIPILTSIAFSLQI